MQGNTGGIDGLHVDGVTGVVKDLLLSFGHFLQQAAVTSGFDGFTVCRGVHSMHFLSRRIAHIRNVQDTMMRLYEAEAATTRHAHDALISMASAVLRARHLLLLKRNGPGGSHVG